MRYGSTFLPSTERLASLRPVSLIAPMRMAPSRLVPTSSRTPAKRSPGACTGPAATCTSGIDAEPRSDLAEIEIAALAVDGAGDAVAPIGHRPDDLIGVGVVGDRPDLVVREMLARPSPPTDDERVEAEHLI
jgi:hypothetical protein